MKDLFKLLVIVNTIFVIFWGFEIFFNPKHYPYPITVGNGMDKMIVWKQKTIDAPIPKFIKRHKERLNFWERNET